MAISQFEGCYNAIAQGSVRENMEGMCCAFQSEENDVVILASCTAEKGRRRWQAWLRLTVDIVLQDIKPR